MDDTVNDQLHIKPAPGLVVRHPDSRQALAVEGELVPADSTYWHRRLADGDVVHATAAAVKTAPQPTQE